MNHSLNKLFIFKDIRYFLPETSTDVRKKNIYVRRTVWFPARGSRRLETARDCSRLDWRLRGTPSDTNMMRHSHHRSGRNTDARTPVLITIVYCNIANHATFHECRTCNCPISNYFTVHYIVHILHIYIYKVSVYHEWHTRSSINLKRQNRI